MKEIRRFGPSLLVSLAVFLSGCSTVERYVYYSPSVDNQDRDGPPKQGCGFKTFGGEPDRYKKSLGKTELVVTAEQRFQPFLWGPWFAAVVPIVPITQDTSRAHGLLYF